MCRTILKELLFSHYYYNYYLTSVDCSTFLLAMLEKQCLRRCSIMPYALKDTQQSCSRHNS